MSSVPQLTYWGIALAVLASRLYIPVPAAFFLMTAGALAAHGGLQLWPAILTGVLGCLAGDCVGFWLGRRWGDTLVAMLCRLSLDRLACSERAHRVFNRWGPAVLIVSKFEPTLDGATPPLAGAEGSPIAPFLVFDAIGSFLWSTVHTSFGFIFADQLYLVFRLAGRFITSVLCMCIPFVLYFGWRSLKLATAMWRLRFRRMSPALLRTKLDAREKIVLSDLQHPEKGETSAEGIPPLPLNTIEGTIHRLFTLVASVHGCTLPVSQGNPLPEKRKQLIVDEKRSGLRTRRENTGVEKPRSVKLER